VRRSSRPGTGRSGRSSRPVAAEAVESTVRYAAGHLFTDDPGQALLLLNGAVQRQTLQTARTTSSTTRHGTRMRPVWQRVASGPKTCEFCAMLIGRGAVYATRCDCWR
jgi:hypothetical protein